MKKLIAILLLITSGARAQMTVETFTLSATGDQITFLKYLPAGYNPSNKYPVLVSLSGDGEKAGKGIGALQASGINRILSDGSLSIPFIVVSPQCPYQNYDNIGSNGTFMPGRMATEMLDTAIARYGGDPDRCYITGLSMGGPSVPNALAFYPNKWAAGVSMASWETEYMYAPQITGGLWDIKLDGDPIAGPPDYNITFLDATKSSDHKYTALAGSGHWIWDQVYSNTWTSLSISPSYPGSSKPMNIYSWLTQHSLSANNSPIALTPAPAPVPVPATLPVAVTEPTGYRKEVPSLIEAELYDVMNGVWVEYCSEGGGDVGFIDAGDFLDYYINVKSSGDYKVNIRYAGMFDGKLEIRNGNGDVLTTTSLPATGDWQNWNTATASISLKGGIQTIRVYASVGGFNLNYLDFE